MRFAPAAEKIKEGRGDGGAPENQGGWLHGDRFAQNAGEAPEEDKKIELEKSGQNLASTLHMRVTCCGFDL